MIKYKKFALIITIFSLFNLCNIAVAEELIIPKQKPKVSLEKKEKIKLKSEILPIKKPTLAEKKNQDLKKVKKETNKLGIIIPLVKPLVISEKKKEKKEKIIKSKYFSKKDFEITKKAISLIEKKKWQSAIKLSKKAKNKSIYDFIVWRYLLERNNLADYSLYSEFLERNANYPRIGRVKYLSEKKLTTKNINPKKIIKIFEENEPLSGFGKMILGESYILNGNTPKGINLIKEGEEFNLEELYENRPVPIYLDETCRFSENISSFAHCVDGVNMKLMKCGGITEALKIIKTARKYKLKTMIGCMSESSVSIAAAAALSGGIDHIDLDSHYNLAPDPSTGAPMVDGVTLPPDIPGHGGELKKEFYA